MSREILRGMVIISILMILGIEISYLEYYYFMKKYKLLINKTE